MCAGERLSGGGRARVAELGRDAQQLPEILGQPETLTRGRPRRCLEIRVSEQDFRRFGHDLEMLRQCQVPKFEPLESVKPLSETERFDMACRLPAALRDPWRGLDNPEMTRAANEGDIAYNQIWIHQSERPIAEDSPSRLRSFSEDVGGRSQAAEARRRELFDAVRKVALPVGRMRAASINADSCPSRSRSTSVRSIASRGASSTRASSLSAREVPLSRTASTASSIASAAPPRKPWGAGGSRRPSIDRAAPTAAAVLPPRPQRPPRAPPGANSLGATLATSVEVGAASVPTSARRAARSSSSRGRPASARSTLPSLCTSPR